ncbi:MAG: c-type cytochrome biogenesis protein CcmI [Sulfitobacter sp.]
MLFWIITLALAALVTLVLARALSRGSTRGVQAASAFDLQVYRDQLAEVERDVARGVVPSEDAARVRTEISRRILVADSATQTTVLTAGAPRRPLLIVMGVLLVAGSLGLYAAVGQPGYGDLALADRIAFAKEVRETRPGQQAAMDSLPEGVISPEVAPQYAALIEQLRETVKSRPDDLQGHRLLAENEANVGNFAAAVQAQREVLRILGADATTQDIGDFGELMVLAAGGYVSPEAEVPFREVLARDQDDGRARYYIGLMLIQTGRPDQTFRLWDGLLRRGPADAAWIAPIQSQIMAVADLAGVEYSMPQIGGSAQPGPSAEDVAAAAEMTAQDRMEMIGGMVAGLSDRLATQGGPPQDWARLISSLGVLGQTEQARAIFDNAMQVFAEDAGALDMIRAAGSQAGVAE